MESDSNTKSIYERDLSLSYAFGNRNGVIQSAATSIVMWYSLWVERWTQFIHRKVDNRFRMEEKTRNEIRKWFFFLFSRSACPISFDARLLNFKSTFGVHFKPKEKKKRDSFIHWATEDDERAIRFHAYLREDKKEERQRENPHNSIYFLFFFVSNGVCAYDVRCNRLLLLPSPPNARNIYARINENDSRTKKRNE